MYALRSACVCARVPFIFSLCYVQLRLIFEEGNHLAWSSLIAGYTDAMWTHKDCSVKVRMYMCLHFVCTLCYAQLSGDGRGDCQADAQLSACEGPRVCARVRVCACVCLCLYSLLTSKGPTDQLTEVLLSSKVLTAQ